MYFVHLQREARDTIAAIATPPGEGGVAIIRISGKDAKKVAQAVWSADLLRYTSHTAHYGHVKAADGTLIDQALILPMYAPRSFTGEDVVEIHCHGGALLSARVLARVLEAGARPADAGEFSKRAYLNGKIDLAQAEAIQELIAAKNDYAVTAAQEQLQGALSDRVRGFQEQLTTLAAILEAWVDFPEEGLEFTSQEEFLAALDGVLGPLGAMLHTFHDGCRVREGIALCLVGRPNVGKSSLMNALLGIDRAIVTELAGTTRDTVEEELRLDGLHLRLVDTAGIREASDIVEAEGIRRSKAAVEKADLVLAVLDLETGLEEGDERILSQLDPARTVVVWNKSDLGAQLSETLSFPEQVKLSAKKGIGMDQLRRAIHRVVWTKGPPEKGEVLLSNLRHKAALEGARSALTNLREGLLEDRSPEFLTLDMREALKQLGTIIGTDISEGILSSIFSQFCVGK